MTETAVEQQQELAGLVKDSDEAKEQKMDNVVNDSIAGQLKQRNTIQFTKEKIEAWLSVDIELTDILLAEEQFSISAKFCVFWKDDLKQFSRLIDEEAMEQIKAKGFAPYEDLSSIVRKKLPFKQGFLLNAVDMEMQRAYLELHDEANDVWKLYFRFECILSEHFELGAFPFDSQFLNLQITYRVFDYYFVTECPDWMKIGDKHLQFKLHLPVKFSTADSVKTTWQPYSPWIDMRRDRKDFEFHFSVIRLRVRRDPSFWLVNGVLPLFLVLACSFAQVVMPFEDHIGDKLGYLITLLLTTAAFQYALSADMPKTAESTMIDGYILWMYFMLFCLVTQVAILYLVEKESDDLDVKLWEYVVCGIFAIIWIWRTSRFLYGYWLYRRSDVDWKTLSARELKIWEKETKGDLKFLKVQEADFFGTDDE